MDNKNSGILVIIGGMLLAFGSFLDWGSVLGFGVTGMDGGDGWFTLIAGVALMGLGYMSYSGRSLPVWLTWIALAVGAVVALINFFDIVGEELIDLGIGMYLMLAGVIVAVVGLVTGRKQAA